MGRAMIQKATVFGERERQIIRERVLACLERVRQQGKRLGRPKRGIAEGRERHQDASERREWHIEGGRDGRLWEWYGAAGKREMAQGKLA